MPRYRVTIAGKNYDAMADLIRKHRLNIAGHTGKKTGRGRYVVDAFADSDQIERLKSEGYGVDVREDVQEAGKKRQSEVRSLVTRAPSRKRQTIDRMSPESSSLMRIGAKQAGLKCDCDMRDRLCDPRRIQTSITGPG